MMRKRIYTDKGTDFMIISGIGDHFQPRIDGKAFIQSNMPNRASDGQCIGQCSP